MLDRVHGARVRIFWPQGDPHRVCTVRRIDSALAKGSRTITLLSRGSLSTRNFHKRAGNFFWVTLTRRSDFPR